MTSAAWPSSAARSRHTPFTGEEGALIYVKVGLLGATLLQPTTG